MGYQPTSASDKPNLEKSGGARTTLVRADVIDWRARMHPSVQTEPIARSPEWRQGREAELAGSKILACPYPEGAQARRWRAGWMASSRTAPRRYASGHGGYTSRFAGGAAPNGEAVSPLVRAARESLRSMECPVCAGYKLADALFCGRCRGFLPRGAFLVLATLEQEEDRARWWQSACADLRGE